MNIHAHTFTAPGLVSLTLMWFGMMAAMMTPTVWPWVRAFARFGGRATGRLPRLYATTLFSSGYLLAWLLYSVAAAMLQRLLIDVGGVDARGGIAPMAGAVILIVAGLVQFAPLKRACLMHCRNPLSYFLTRWCDGPAGGFRMGFGHGLFCVGCCWALMATALAVGMTNLWWMAALAAVAFVEQVVPYGDRLRVPMGMVLVAYGLRIAA